MNLRIIPTFFPYFAVLFVAYGCSGSKSATLSPSGMKATLAPLQALSEEPSAEQLKIEPLAPLTGLWQNTNDSNDVLLITTEIDPATQALKTALVGWDTEPYTGQPISVWDPADEQVLQEGPDGTAQANVGSQVQIALALEKDRTLRLDVTANGQTKTAHYAWQPPESRANRIFLDAQKPRMRALKRMQFDSADTKSCQKDQWSKGVAMDLACMREFASQGGKFSAAALSDAVHVADYDAVQFLFESGIEVAPPLSPPPSPDDQRSILDSTLVPMGFPISLGKKRLATRLDASDIQALLLSHGFQFSPGSAIVESVAQGIDIDGDDELERVLSGAGQSAAPTVTDRAFLNFLHEYRYKWSGQGLNLAGKMLSQGANPNASSGDGSDGSGETTVALEAIRSGDLELVQLLKSHGTRFENARDWIRLQIDEAKEVLASGKQRRWEDQRAVIREINEWVRTDSAFNKKSSGAPHPKGAPKIVPRLG